MPLSIINPPTSEVPLGTMSSQNSTSVVITGGTGQFNSLLKTNRGTDGKENSAVACYVNANSSAGAKVNGFVLESDVSTRYNRDSVAFYSENTAITQQTLDIAGYTATGATLATPYTGLKVGAYVDTLHSPKYTGRISAVLSDTSFSVHGWFQQGNAAAGQVPPGTTDAVFNATTNIFVMNLAAYLSGGGYSRSATGIEVDLYNTVGDPTDEYGAPADPTQTNPVLWGVDVTNQSPAFKCNVAFNHRKHFLIGFKSSGAETASFLVENDAQRQPAHGFLSRQTNGNVIAHEVSGVTRFRVSSVGASMRLGYAGITPVIDLYAVNNQSQQRDARIIVSGGTVGQSEKGTLDLRASEVQIRGEDVRPFGRVRRRTINTTPYTLAATDAGYLLWFTAASPTTVNVPAGLGDEFHCLIGQGTANDVTMVGTTVLVVGESGTLNTGGQYAVGELYQIPTSDQYVFVVK